MQKSKFYWRIASMVELRIYEPPSHVRAPRDASLRAFHSDDCILKTYRRLYITSVAPRRRPPVFRPHDRGIPICIRAATRRQETRWNSERRFNSDLITIASLAPLSPCPSSSPSLRIRSLVIATIAEASRSWHPFLSIRFERFNDRILSV